MTDVTDEISIDPGENDFQKEPPASLALMAGWALTLLVAIGSSATFGLFFGMFARPRAFGARDGQGAAGLAALLMLVAAAVAVVSLGLVFVLGRKLRVAGLGWAVPASLALPLLAGGVAVLLSMFS